MKINDIHSVVRGLDPQEVLRQRSDKDQSAQIRKNSPDGDKLDISLSARITSEYNANGTSGTDPLTELTAKEISDIRTRIANGDYDRGDVLNTLAQQIRDYYRQ
jgi:hypothetical protein